jgi:hypothetical protein
VGVPAIRIDEGTEDDGASVGKAKRVEGGFLCGFGTFGGAGCRKMGDARGDCAKKLDPGEEAAEEKVSGEEISRRDVAVRICSLGGDF